MIPIRPRSRLLFGSSHASPPRSPAFSLVSPWYNFLSLAIPVPPPLLQLALNANATNRGTRQLPNITSCYYTNILPFGLLIAFRRCSCAFKLLQDPTVNDESMPISSSTHTLPKKLYNCHSLHLICFRNPKRFLDPRDLFNLILTRFDVNRPILYHGGV